MTASGPRDQLLTVSEVALMTRIPEGTLRRWRSVGGVGPTSARIGPKRVVYRESDVIAWIESQFERERERTSRA